MKILLIILYMAIVNEEFDCKEIYISQIHGNDEADCGRTQQGYCKTLSYTIYQIATSNDTLFLDGGQYQPNKYTIDSTIQLFKNIHLKKMQNSSYNPIILPSIKSTRQQFAFNVSRLSSRVCVTIESINFENIYILQCTGDVCHVTIENVIYTTASVILTAFSNSSNSIILFSKNNNNRDRKILSTLIISNSSFTSPGGPSVKIERNNINITVVDSHMFGYSILVNNSYINAVTIHLNNVTFSAAKRTANTINITKCINLLKIENCRFQNMTNSSAIYLKCDGISSKTQIMLSNVYVTYCTSVLFLYSTNYIVNVTNMVFKHNIESGLLRLTNTYFTARNINIFNNTIKDKMMSLTTSTVFIDGMEIKETDSPIIIKNDGSQIHILHSNITDSNINNWIYQLTTSLITAKRKRNSEPKYSIKYDTDKHFLDNDTIDTRHTSIILTNFQFINNTINNDMFSIPLNEITTPLYIILRNVTLQQNHYKSTFINCNSKKQHISKYSNNNLIHLKMNNIIIKDNSFMNHVIISTLSSVSDSNYLNIQFVIHNLTMQNNGLQQSFLYTKNVNCSSSFDTINIIHNRIKGHLFEMNGDHITIVSFTLKYNEIAHDIINAKNCNINIHSGLILLNDIIENVVDTERESHVTIQNVIIDKNNYSTAFYFKKSSVVLDCITLKGNNPSGRVQELAFHDLEDVRRIKNASLILKNMWLHSRSTYAIKAECLITISMFDGNLQMDNNSMQIRNEHMSAISIIYAKNVLIKSNFFLFCPYGTVPEKQFLEHGFSSKYVVSCVPCRKGRYSITEKPQYIEASNQTFVHADNETPYQGCRACPRGGDCYNGIPYSAGNFYGYKTNTNEINYIPCPPLYCCSKDTRPCKSFNSCNDFREGKLCGKCNKDFYLSFYSVECHPKTTCNKQVEFWIIYVCSAILLMLTFYFMDDIKELFKKLVTVIKNIFRDKYTAASCACIKSQDTEYGLTDLKKIEDKNERDCDFVDTETNKLQRTVKHIKLRKTKSLDLLKNDEIRKKTCFEHTDNTSTLKGSILTVHSSADDIIINSSEDNIVLQPQTKPYTFSGVLNILISFFQVKSLLAIDYGPANHRPNIYSKLTQLFNLDIVTQFSSTFCPTPTLNTINKYFIKEFLFVFLPIFCIGILTIITIVINKSRCVTLTSFGTKLSLCYLRIILFGYKNIASFSMIIVNCVQVNNEMLLFLSGNIKCYTLWQYLDFLFLTIWVLPFPFALAISYQLYLDKSISFNVMMLSLSFPLITVWFLMRKKIYATEVTYPHNEYQYNNIRIIFEEPYRLKKGKIDQYIFWEHWRLIQRLMLSAIKTYFIDPMKQVCFSTPCILLFVGVYWKILPFKKELKLLHWLEVSSLISFCYLLVNSVFKAFIYTYDIQLEDYVPILIEFFNYMDYVFSPVTFIILFFVIFPLVKKLCNVWRKEK